jgi:hypothetical protein
MGHPLWLSLALVAVLTQACEPERLFVERVPADAGENSPPPRDAGTPPPPEPCTPGDEGCGCAPDAVLACYSGPVGLVGVGACQAGTRRCHGGAWGACVGEVLPSAERCDGEDDDCDGEVDAPFAPRACYSGPAGTEGVGACRGGTAACASGQERCADEVTPASEICDNLADDDCDGEVDEGCAPVGVPCEAGPRVEDPSGEYILVATYEGGRVIVDVDVPVPFIGFVAYHPVEVALVGVAVGSVRRVHVTGYQAAAAQVTGVDPAVVERIDQPASPLEDPLGWPTVLCASTCEPGVWAGGCNTVPQLLGYFDRAFGAPRRWWHLQYANLGGATFTASGGGCCR